ncbi:(R)-mandelonitrile lyase [Rhizobium esperanzae]|uniref:4-carboxymuconolactone decarboxylase n=1 Tax=Rhizobium esperanzae TaxID=1967781 RepID=A0A7W6R4V2_9HYPH|nr:carboxymuconolactone decarboxylase family protein [Rhizobium esperanzae]MBB4236926.1 4-carboxymuconolactone decarboxylase [Rhizobium esperanzae]
MKTLATGIAISALTAASAEAQESRRVAPPAVYKVAPGLGHFTDDVLFGEFWMRKELSPRDRSLVTIATLVATGKSAQVGSHVRRALDNGVQPGEVGEVVTHLAFYSGWPNAISAVLEVEKVFDERKIAPVTASARIQLEAAAEAARGDAVDTGILPTAPALADLTNRVLFGDLWQRPDLSARDRSLVTMAALVALGQPDQLAFHASRAMDSGLTREESAEAVTHVAFYAGWPRAMSAVPVLRNVFETRDTAAMTQTAAKDMKIIRRGQEPMAGPAERFTGEVVVTAAYKGDGPARIGGATVSFSAGAHTAWHTHPLGQTLFVVSGKGWVQKDGGPIEAMEPGDVVWIPPMVKHWHGAASTEPMVHFAVSEAVDGSSVSWMEKVSPDDYAKGSGAEQRSPAQGE